MKPIIILFVIALLSGCASMIAPTEDLIREKTVIEIGGNEPDSKEYIIHIPAGKEFPVTLDVDGSLLRKKGKTVTFISLDKELYLFNYWASYDGKHWSRLNELFGFTISVGVKPKGGHVTVGISQRE